MKIKLERKLVYLSSCCGNSLARTFIIMDNKKPLGIYVHIPFCEKKCDYCDFLSEPANDELKEAYIKALLNEIKSYKDLMDDYQVKTIFIGGGTPSNVAPEFISEILQHINRCFSINAKEITIETNPGNLTKEKLQTYKDAGINRLSIGLQSANNIELKLLGRIHTYEEFLDNYYLARSLGFTNINIDLISGLPGQSILDWQETLEKIINLSPEHISAYSLIIEEGTPFYDQYKADGLEENKIDDETDRLIYSKTKKMMEINGYNRYEISNYSKKGYESKHNLSYWERTPYLGLGLGSSSLIDNTRFHNEENINKYIKNSTNHELLHKEKIKLTKQESMEEFMFLGLRKTQGIKKSDFKKEFNINLEEIYEKPLSQSLSEGLVEEREDYIFLTDYGLDLSNYVLARFLI